MSLPVFPSLPTMAWNSEKRQKWNTLLQKSGNGRRKTLCQQAYPEWELECSYTCLDDDEIARAAGFFASMQGTTKPFLWLDSEDYQETGVRIGTGNGTTTEFQLLRNLGDYFVEPVRDPIAETVKIYINGSLTSITLLTDGWLKFSSPPPSNSVITADFKYYWRVAFNDDELNWSNFWYGFYELKTIKLVTVR